MEGSSHAELLAACRVLFGRQLEPAFLGHLQESGLRSAWRRTALLTHPDRVANRAARPRLTERFIEARRAYGLLRDYLGRRDRHRARHARRTAPPPTTPPRPQHPPRPRPAAGAEQTLPSRLPQRRLRLGEFLYHSRVISFGSLVEALLWQRRQRDRFCEIGLRWGYLDEAAAARLLSGRLPHERVGAAAKRLRLLTPFQVRTVLAHQRSLQRPLGDFFVSRGEISHADLSFLLRRQECHNAAVVSRLRR